MTLKTFQNLQILAYKVTVEALFLDLAFWQRPLLFCYDNFSIASNKQT